MAKLLDKKKLIKSIVVDCQLLMIPRCPQTQRKKRLCKEIIQLGKCCKVEFSADDFAFILCEPKGDML